MAVQGHPDQLKARNPLPISYRLYVNLGPFLQCTVWRYSDLSAFHSHLTPLLGANLFELDGQGKARREAARRRNSECKINLSSRNSSRSNGSRPTAQR